MISVVIPLYNKAPHITKAVESVLAQTDPPDEVIVVDDGSTDGGGDLVLPYCEKYGVRLVRQENAGESAARNRGVEIASNQYVAFLDADDWWLPNHISTLRRLIARFPAASLFSTAHVIERSGQNYRPRCSYSDGWAGIVDDFFQMYSSNFGLVNSITSCVRKSDFKNVGGFPLGIRRGPDIICWINMALHYPVAHAEVVTAVYYQDAVNRTDRLREAEPPGSLQHIAKLLQRDDLTSAQRAGLTRLFDRIAFFTAAGFRANGDITGVDSIRKLAWTTGRYRISLATTALRYTPAGVLRVAKRFRHPRVSALGRS